MYLPSSYDGSKRFPLWVHLHGVFWNTMDNISQKIGRPVQGTEIIPVWDHTVRLFGDQAIIVYPQSTGNPGTGNPSEGQGVKYRQFFNTLFWQCSIGVCVDKSVDDVGFVEKVMQDIPNRFAVNKGQILLTGESSGGMLVHVLLCQSSVIPGMITAAVDILGGVGADYVRSGKCANGPPAAFLKMHGVKDPFITYDKQILVDGVNFLSAIEATQHRAARNGCGNKGQMAGPMVADAQMQCTDFCGAKPGAKPAKLCGMTEVLHDTDHPWPGFVYQQSWKFFKEVLQSQGLAAARGGGGTGTRLERGATNARRPMRPRPGAARSTPAGRK